YVEHNPNVSKPGLAGYVEYYNAKKTSTPALRVLPAAPAQTFAKGDYVVMVWTHDDVDGKGAKFQYNSYDVLRIQNGKIQEHWDDKPKTESTAPVVTTVSTFPQFKNSPDEQKNEDIVIGLYRDVLQYHHFELAPKYMAANYIQHNYTDPQGRDPLMEHIQHERPSEPEPLQPQMKNRPQLIVTKGNITLMMTTRQAKDPSDAAKTYPFNHFEMVRVESGFAQEHWDSSIGPGGKRQ
ncbi:MAG: ester cyclase, partial [Bryobacteraceae bacterium]